MKEADAAPPPLLVAHEHGVETWTLNRAERRNPISDEAMVTALVGELDRVTGDGGAWLLPRIIGHARASVLALTGRRIDAATAQRWGLVFEVVAAEDLMASATALASEIADQPRDAVRMTKALLRRAPDIGLDATLELSAAMQPLCHTTDEHHNAVATLLSTTSK
jgi:enoyl-CoA hydratase/carnithine racemase